MHRFHFFLLCLFALLAPSTVLAQQVRVAYVPISVTGEYKPLDTDTVSKLLLQSLKSAAPDLEFVELQVDMESLDPEAEVAKAIQTAKENGATYIAWGDVSFQRAAQPSRGDVFNAGRLKLMITAIADIQVMTVADQQRILSQPTMVTSSGQSRAFTETGDPQTEQKLARDSVTEAASTIVDVIRQRRATSAP